MKLCRQCPRYVVLIGLPLLFVGASVLSTQTFGEGPFLLAIGLLTAALSGLSVRASLAKRRWPTASGVVTHVHVLATPGLFGWRDTERDRTHIQYRYEVNGQEYHGEFFCHPNEDGVWRRLGGYPTEGSACAVHYDPCNPSISSLAPGPGSLAIWLLVLGLAGIGAGGYIAFR